MKQLNLDHIIKIFMTKSYSKDSFFFPGMF